VEVKCSFLTVFGAAFFAPVERPVVLFCATTRSLLACLCCA